MFFTAATAELSNGPSPLDLAIDTEAIVPSGNMPICNVTDMLLRADGGRLQPSEALTRIRSSKLPAVSSPRSSAKACCRSGLSDSKSASACAFLSSADLRAASCAFLAESAAAFFFASSAAFFLASSAAFFLASSAACFLASSAAAFLASSSAFFFASSSAFFLAISACCFS